MNRKLTASTPPGPPGQLAGLVAEALASNSEPAGDVTWWPSLGRAVNEYLSEPAVCDLARAERAIKALRQKMRSIDERYVVENVTSKDDSLSEVLSVRVARNPTHGVVYRLSLREFDSAKEDLLEYVAREIHRSPPNSLRPVR